MNTLMFFLALTKGQKLMILAGGVIILIGIGAILLYFRNKRKIQKVEVEGEILSVSDPIGSTQNPNLSIPIPIILPGNDLFVCIESKNKKLSVNLNRALHKTIKREFEAGAKFIKLQCIKDHYDDFFAEKILIL